MPHFAVDKIQQALNHVRKPVKGSHVHVAGVAYKKNIDDVRESPALDVILLLEKMGAKVTFSDPFVPVVRLDGVHKTSSDLMENAAQADCVVIITDHAAFDYPALLEKSQLIVDTRNAMKGLVSDKIVRL